MHPRRTRATCASQASLAVLGPDSQAADSRRALTTLFSLPGPMTLLPAPGAQMLLPVLAAWWLVCRSPGIPSLCLSHPVSAKAFVWEGISCLVVDRLGSPSPACRCWAQQCCHVVVGQSLLARLCSRLEATHWDVGVHCRGGIPNHSPESFVFLWGHVGWSWPSWGADTFCGYAIQGQIEQMSPICLHGTCSECVVLP